MSFIDSVKRSNMKNKAIVFILCGLSVAVALAELILWSIRYCESYNEGYYELALYYRYYLIFPILLVASILLFAIYLFFCCKEKYGVYLLLASIAIVVAKSFLMAIKVYDDEFSIAFEIVRAVGYLLLAISALNGFTNKNFFYLSICVILLAGVVNTTVNAGNSIVFDIVWLVFGFSNTIPPLIGVKRSGEAMKIEALKYKLDLGIITKEQYDEQRKEIIDNL